MFTAFERPDNLPDAIARQLRQKILSGDFKEGERLPTEHELAGQFGVSRNVVRESIARLKLDGLIETRRGVGTFVAGNVNGRRFKIIQEDLLDIRQLLQVSQLRIEIEAGAAALAAQARTDEQLVELEAALRRTDAAGKDWELGAEAALQFHLVIARCSNNPYFTRLMEHLSYVIHNAVRTLRYRNSGTPRIGHVDAEHQEIFDAIRRRDSDAARAAVRKHLNNGIAAYMDKERT
ncbi:MAG: GntR family transcriptional regulator [Bordetella sp. SCN 67-23]|nr:FadR family transcriptional regulator [Burkholderiales bacterium]ODS76028.1 MAG: GntR family transcriptional regulator [Bordetella sp. SCN 67-23]ODU96613.1 MAG: GntR family transcriptional regulator [Bordetella sp. SCN 68-11]OJW92256.1 MAG: GntR family transcriptional regulator [Burkholderiales bacterium 67-32]